MDTSVVRERRRLNDEIENSFVTAAQSAANIEMKIASGKGSLKGDFQDFHSNFNYLIRLTMRLKEMGLNEKGSKMAALQEKISKWITTKTTTLEDGAMEAHCQDGLGLFDEYYDQLMHNGVISLPTKKG